MTKRFTECILFLAHQEDVLLCAYLECHFCAFALYLDGADPVGEPRRATRLQNNMFVKARTALSETRTAPSETKKPINRTVIF